MSAPLAMLIPLLVMQTWLYAVIVELSQLVHPSLQSLHWLSLSKYPLLHSQTLFFMVIRFGWVHFEQMSLLVESQVSHNGAHPGTQTALVMVK